jgi:GTP:adenosylcobinamide-phosphate guanylyltransferase
MDAVVTAGGIPKPEEPLYPYTQGKSKALLDVAGRPMIQWVLDALSGAQKVNNVIIMGLPADSGVTCTKPLTYLPNQGGMLANILAGVNKAIELNSETKHVLLVSSDIPAITAPMVDWVIEATTQSDEDIYYNLIERVVMEKRFPGSKRSYTRLKDIEVCGGDMNVVNTATVTKNHEIWNKLIEAQECLQAGSVDRP